MVSEACQQAMDYLDRVATCTGPTQDVLSLLEEAQQLLQVRYSACRPAPCLAAILARHCSVTPQAISPVICFCDAIRLASTAMAATHSQHALLWAFVFS